MAETRRKRISAPQIKETLAKAGIPRRGIRTPDRFYVLPSHRYLTGRFSRLLRTYLVRHGVLEYRRGVNDCDDFARQACAYAAMTHARSFRRDNPKGRLPALAVAEIWYTDAKLGKHATFIAIVESTKILRLDRVNTTWNRRKITRIRERPISREELKSCTYCRLG